MKLLKCAYLTLSYILTFGVWLICSQCPEMVLWKEGFSLSMGNLGYSHLLPTEHVGVYC